MYIYNIPDTPQTNNNKSVASSHGFLDFLWICTVILPCFAHAGAADYCTECHESLNMAPGQPEWGSLHGSLRATVGGAPVS